MNGLDEIRDKLRGDSNVTATVGTYSGKTAIYGQPLAPLKYTGKCITMYQSLPTQGGLEYGEYGNTVNCFAKKYSDVLTIQSAVFTALNRLTGDNETFFRCMKLPVITPRQSGDDYNAPVEVIVRQR